MSKVFRNDCDNHWYFQINWGRGRPSHSWQSLMRLWGCHWGYFYMFSYVFNHPKIGVKRKTSVKPVKGLWNRDFISLTRYFLFFWIFLKQQTEQRPRTSSLTQAFPFCFCSLHVWITFYSNVLLDFSFSMGDRCGIVSEAPLNHAAVAVRVSAWRGSPTFLPHVPLPGTSANTEFPLNYPFPFFSFTLFC